MIDNNALAVLVVIAIIATLGIGIAALSIPGAVRTVGMAQGTVGVGVPQDITFTLIVDSIDFGTLGLGARADTTTDAPIPFIGVNDGSDLIDITAEASSLFMRTPNPTSNFQIMCGDSTETVCPPGSVTTWTDIPPEGGIPILIVNDLGFLDSADMIEFEIAVGVPLDEPSGIKSSTVTLTATLAT